MAQAARYSPSVRLSIAHLEDRTVPNGVTSTFANGVFAILGTAAADTVTVSQTATTVTVNTTNANGSKQFTAPTAAVKEIQIRAQAGNDVVTLNGTVTLREVLYGGDGNDLLTAGSANDALSGENGDDKLWGGAGNDTLDGGAGNDQLFGEAGTDALTGGAGNDWMEAGTATESAVGGDGTDWNAHVWAMNGVSVSDVKQTGTGACIFLSSAAAAAKQGINLADRMKYVGNFTYEVTFYDARTKAWSAEKVKFDGTMTTYNGYLMDPLAAVEGESWVILMQRAYLQHFYGLNPLNGTSMASFRGESNANQAEAALTGRTAVTTSIPTTAQTIQTMLTQGKVVTAASFAGQGGHSYSVLNVYQVNGEWRIDVHNPWGVDQNPNTLPAIKDANANDGVISLKYADFVRYYAQISVS